MKLSHKVQETSKKTLTKETINLRVISFLPRRRGKKKNRNEEMSAPLPEMGFPGSSKGKESACQLGDVGSVPGSGRSPGEGNGSPLQYSYLENSMGLQRVRHNLVTKQQQQ